MDKKTDKQLAEHLRPYHFKKGQSGNPKGRPKGSQSLKDFARQYLLSLTDDEKIEFLNHLPHDLVWRMSEGNPHSTEEMKIDMPASLIGVIKLHGAADKNGGRELPPANQD